MNELVLSGPADKAFATFDYSGYQCHRTPPNLDLDNKKNLRSNCPVWFKKEKDQEDE